TGTIAGNGLPPALTVDTAGAVVPVSITGQTSVLTTDSAQFNPGSAFNVILDDTNTQTSSQLASTGTGGIKLGSGNSTLSVDVVSSAVGDVFTILTSTGGGTITGTFAGLPDGTIFT